MEENKIEEGNKMKKESFDKTLTKKERKAKTYLEWSNETLGRLVKDCAAKLFNTDIKGYESIKFMAASYTLVFVVHETNAGQLKQTLSGMTIKEKEIGDWEIIVRQKKKPSSTP